MKYTEFADALNGFYTTDKNQWRVEMCYFRENNPEIMEELHFNENEAEYIHVLCDFYLE